MARRRKRFRWPIILRFLAFSLVLTSVYIGAIRIYRARVAELARLDELLDKMHHNLPHDPREWIMVERQRAFKEIEFLFYFFLLIIPISFAVIAIISFIKSSTRSGSIYKKNEADQDTQERNAALRMKIQNHFAKKRS